MSIVRQYQRLYVSTSVNKSVVYDTYRLHNAVVVVLSLADGARDHPGDPRSDPVRPWRPCITDLSRPPHRWRGIRVPPYNPRHTMAKSDRSSDVTPSGEHSAAGGNRGPPPLRLQLLSGLAGLQLVVLLTLAFAVDRWLAPSRAILLALAVLIAVDTVLLVLFTHLRLRRLVLQPVERLIEGSERLAAGDEDYRMPFVASAEMHLLGDAIVRMAGRATRDRHLLRNRATLSAYKRPDRTLAPAHSCCGVSVHETSSQGRAAPGVSR